MVCVTLKAVGFISIGLFFALLISGCSTNEVAGSSYRYEVNITGLDNCSSGTATEIIVPVAMRGGTTLITNDSISEQKQARLKNWSAELVDTQYGKMISLRTSGRVLDNINFELGGTLVAVDTPVPDRQNLIKEILASPVSPMSGEIADPYSVQSSFLNTRGKIFFKSSYIYLDNNLTSDSADKVISVDIGLQLAEGSPNIQQGIGSNYNIVIREKLPAGARGWIPVTVQSDTQLGG